MDIGRDKDNLAYQAFPWSLVAVCVICWIFIFGVLFLYLRGLLYGLSLVLLPEGISPFVSIGLPVQGVILLILVTNIRRNIIKGHTPSYIQILISLILTLTTAFSVFLVLSQKKGVEGVKLSSAFYAPYDVTKTAGVNLESQKFPVELDEKINEVELKDIKREHGSLTMRFNRYLRPAGNIANNILKHNSWFLLFFIVPTLIAAGFSNRFLLRKQYGEALRVSFLPIALIWIFTIIISIPIFIFSEYFLGLIAVPALGNILTIMLIRKNILKVVDQNQAKN